MLKDEKGYYDATKVWTEEIQEQFPQYEIANDSLHIHPKTGKFGVIIRHKERGVFAFFRDNTILPVPQEWARRHSPKFEFLIADAVDKSELTTEQIELLLGIPEEVLTQWIDGESLPDVWLENLICDNIIRMGEELKRRKAELENEVLYGIKRKK